MDETLLRLKVRKPVFGANSEKGAVIGVAALASRRFGLRNRVHLVVWL